MWLQLPNVQRMPVVHTGPLSAMQSPVLGAVLHTTNAPLGPQTFARFQTDFAASGPIFRSAHFIVDRDGAIAQFRDTDDGAAHMGGQWNTHYIGIEHIARHMWPLTDPQIDSSADLLIFLSLPLNFPLSAVSNRGQPGVGVHNQFNGTSCVQGPFSAGGTFGPDFISILQRAPARSPVGRTSASSDGLWEVRIGSDKLIYDFGPNDFKSGVVDLADLNNNYQMTGTWRIRNNSDTDPLEINWPNGSLEQWDVPLRSSGQQGQWRPRPGQLPKPISAKRI